MRYANTRPKNFFAKRNNMYELTYVYASDSKRHRYSEPEEPRKRIKLAESCPPSKSIFNISAEKDMIDDAPSEGPITTPLQPLVLRSKRAAWKLVYIPKLSFENLSITTKTSLNVNDIE